YALLADIQATASHITQQDEVNAEYATSLQAQQRRKTNESITTANTLESPHMLWRELTSQFQTIIQEATDYHAYLSSSEVEERMMTEAFLVFKDRFVLYLRDFILYLQHTALKIEGRLVTLDGESITPFLKKCAEQIAHDPSRFEERDVDEVYEEIKGTWANIIRWFVGGDTQRSEVYKLQEETTAVIRKITRIVQRLTENTSRLRSRQSDYLHAAKLFDACETIEDAHALSSMLFGAPHSMHLYVDNSPTDDIYTTPLAVEPTTVECRPRVRTYRERTRAHAVIDKSEAKRAAYETYMNALAARETNIRAYMNEGVIRFDVLPVVSTEVRKTLLGWLSKALGNEEQQVKTEFGFTVKLRKQAG
ncbi:MAG: TIGR02677 family protein, partial [Bacilli bacterium]